MDDTPWQEDEIGEARLDVAALLRAEIGGDKKAIAVILDGAGERGVRAVAETLLSMSGDLLVRLTVAASLIPDDNPAKLVALTADTALFMAEAPIREAVEANLARVQGEIISERVTGEELPRRAAGDAVLPALS